VYRQKMPLDGKQPIRPKTFSEANDAASSA